MGGGYSGGLPIESLRTLEEKARDALKRATDNHSPHVFISFAHEDIDLVNLLRGQAKNDNSTLQFDDHSVKQPFDSVNAEYVKAQIREKIARASATIVFLSPHAATSRWVDWEIRETLRQGKKVLGIYQGAPPQVIPKVFSEMKLKVIPWSHEEITRSLRE